LRSVLSFLTLLLAVDAFSAGAIKSLTIQSKILSEGGESAQRTLNVCLPDGYDTSGISYPVLYLVPGNGGDSQTYLGGGYAGLGNTDVNVSLIVDRLIHEGRIKPLIVACLEDHRSWFYRWKGNQQQYSIAPFDDYILHDVVSLVDSTFRTIPERNFRAIAGHSRGGYDAFYMTLSYPEVFSVGGGLSSVFIRTLLDTRREILNPHDLKTYPIRLWLYAGRNDNYQLAQPNADFAKALLEDFGIPTEYVEDDGDHSSTIDQRIGDLIEFFSKARR
jgi:enterochelin esterase-like enzyme